MSSYLPGWLRLQRTVNKHLCNKNQAISVFNSAEKREFQNFIASLEHSFIKRLICLEGYLCFRMPRICILCSKSELKHSIKLLFLRHRWLRKVIIATTQNKNFDFYLIYYYKMLHQGKLISV